MEVPHKLHSATHKPYSYCRGKTDAVHTIIKSISNGGWEQNHWVREERPPTQQRTTSLQGNTETDRADRIHKLDSDNLPSDLWMSTLSPTTIWLGMAVGMITDLSSIGVQKSLWSKKFFWLPKNWINEQYRKQVLKEFKSVAKYSAGFRWEKIVFLSNWNNWTFKFEIFTTKS